MAFEKAVPISISKKKVVRYNRSVQADDIRAQTIYEWGQKQDVFHWREADTWVKRVLDPVLGSNLDFKGGQTRRVLQKYCGICRVVRCGKGHLRTEFCGVHKFIHVGWGLWRTR